MASHRLVATCLRTAAIVAAFFIAVPVASAQAPVALGANGAWEAYQYEEGGNKVCYMVSAPEKDEGNYAKRGNIYLFITHRPSIRQMDEVTFEIGYTFKPSSTLDVTIGGDSFQLVTDKSKAWAQDVATDRALVNSMKRGAQLVASGVSSRGTKTKDTYSLIGFTASYNLISRACR